MKVSYQFYFSGRDTAEVDCWRDLPTANGNNTSLFSSFCLLNWLAFLLWAAINLYFLRQLRYGKQNKGQEDIKASIDGGMKAISDQVNKDIYRDKLQQIFLVLSALPEQSEASLIKLKNELCNTFTNEIKACIMLYERIPSA